MVKFKLEMDLASEGYVASRNYDAKNIMLDLDYDWHFVNIKNGDVQTAIVKATIISAVKKKEQGYCHNKNL